MNFASYSVRPSLVCLGVMLASSNPALGQVENSDPAGNVVPGETLDPSLYGESRIETMEEAIQRDFARPAGLDNPKGRQGAQGVWTVPSRRGSFYPNSGKHYITNKWGDTRMGIGFPRPTDVHGVSVAGQAALGVWTTGLRVSGYRNGQLVDQTDWFEDIDDSHDWFEIDFTDVDRIVFESKAVVDGGGWYALDDLTYSMEAVLPGQPRTRTVLDFEDGGYRRTLTGSDYGGLVWETGTGDFKVDEAVPPPMQVKIAEDPNAKFAPAPPASQGTATLPILKNDFPGVIRGDANSFSFPPDTCGAIGPNHFVEVVNRNFAIYDRTSGTELVNIHLQSFLPGSNGDPRVVWDQYDNRFIVIVSDFSDSRRLYLAVSTTSDPTGSWFKTDFLTDQGIDAGCWPDYETLGVDANGIYTGVFMVGCGMSIFALDKAPLIAASPSLGTITAFRGFPFEGAIQPMQTYGSPGVEYFISQNSSSAFRVRQLTGPLTSPTLTDLGTVSVTIFGSAPDAPALGSTTNINTIGPRPLNAIYRNGSIWMTHDVSVSGRAACRWYEINPITMTVVQSGTISDSTLSYYYGSIAVNADNDVVMGFSGSDATQYVAAYYTGRRSTDPAGLMATPVLLKAGEDSYTNIDGFGRNRWGDYSLCSVDPNDDRTFFTVQEYALLQDASGNDRWATWIAELSFCSVPPVNDCNNNCIEDTVEVGDGSTPDCNANGIPDSCDIFSPSLDCNANGIPDECEDCNNNGIADSCEFVGFLDESSGQLSPIGLGSPVQYVILAAPQALGDVTIDFAAIAQLGSAQKEIAITINGVNYPDMFNDSNAVDCPTMPDIDQLIIPMAEYNALLSSGDLTIDLTADSSLPFDCNGSPPWISIDISYVAPAQVNDTNNNGIPDECDLARGDNNIDGVVDVEDLLVLLGAWGLCPAPCPADSDLNGIIDVEDLLILLGGWG